MGCSWCTALNPCNILRDLWNTVVHCWRRLWIVRTIETAQPSRRDSPTYPRFRSHFSSPVQEVRMARNRSKSSTEDSIHSRESPQGHPNDGPSTAATGSQNSMEGSIHSRQSPAATDSRNSNVHSSSEEQSGSYYTASERNDSSGIETSSKSCSDEVSDSPEQNVIHSAQMPKTEPGDQIHQETSEESLDSHNRYLNSSESSSSLLCGLSEKTYRTFY